MSSSLHWRPRPKPPEENDLPSALKYALSRNSGNGLDFFQDGVTYDKGSLPYLCGLRDGGVEGADELIGLIRLHGEVELYLEH